MSPVPTKPVRSRGRRAKVAGAAVATLATLALIAPTAPAAAADAAPIGPLPVSPQLESLDRGLVAAVTGAGVYLTWRLSITEATGSSATGLTGTDFAVYRDGERLGVVTDSTNYLDAGGSASASYAVAPITDGVEGEPSAAVTPFAQNYANLPLQIPAGGTTPVGENYTYSASDMSVGDLDGDGSYEYLVKWEPSNSKDNSQVGYTGNVYLDAYQADGTLLWRLDLGRNIRAGAHYTQYMVSDFDGDGRSEVMLKTAPGTRTIEGGTSTYITLPDSDVAAGVTHDDDYRLSKQGYYDHLVSLFEGWDERPEVVEGDWPATLEQAWGTTPKWDYPLSHADAIAATDYFMDVYAPARSGNNRLHNVEGFVLEGPEYLTVFDGASGAELETVPYQPGRTDDGLLWGDYAMTRIEPGNRNDRFLAGVAYLDGEHPSAVFARGYYTRTTVATYDWDGEHLSTRWFIDSGFVPMTNPFNDSPHGRDGTDPVYGKITTQGFHSLSAADVDGDGKQEIVYGSATLDDDGSVLYSSFATLPPGSAAPGTEARLGHGDAMHVTDIDPARPGLEIFTVHEGATSAPYGYDLRDAKTGEVLYGAYSGRDTGRGMVGDVRTDIPGLETWAIQLRAANGTVLGSQMPGTNQSIHWAADLTTAIVNGSGNANVTIDRWQGARLLNAVNTRSNNGTKGNPSLVADVFGDWREELLVRTADSSAVRIYFSTEVTNHKLYTLMHDPQYRAEVARQNTTYNQPSYTSFYLASDMDFSKVPLLDRTPPVITGPADLLLPETASFLVDVSAEDPESGVRSLEIAFDGEPVEAGDSIPLAGLAGEHTLTVRAVNTDDAASEASYTLVVFADDGSTTKPAKGVLSSNSGWATGLSDGSYSVTMNVWWGTNAGIFRLYENGQLIATQYLDPASPAAQAASVAIAGRPNGSYVYTGELENAAGITATGGLTVDVRDASPGKPVLSNDNWDGNGVYTVTANLWWGTNATSYRLLEDGVVVAEGALTASTPNAQAVSATLEGRARGTHRYVIEFTNAAGTTASQPMDVVVR